MTAERWTRVEEIFNAALEKPERERHAYLVEACGGDGGLLGEVESLLAERDAPSLISPAAELLRQAAAPALAAGRMLGHYRVEEKLGEGGMGAVYKARDSHLKRFVALKVLPPEKVADPGRKHRFIQEARSASALNHPNIVTIHDIDQQDGVDFIAMEYVEGKTLDELIGRKGLKLNEALKYGVQIADALAKAHAAGIVHRDLKPGNVMVTGDGRVKVLDFGLAKLTEAAPVSPEDPSVTEKPATETGLIMGTVSYMSPEQAEGKQVDARSDIFSFGSLLYEMLTGRRAFRRDSLAMTLAAIVHLEPPPLPAEIPQELERVIQRCLRKEPERRIQHMDDVKLELEEIREVPEPVGRARLRARSPLLAGLLGAVLGIVLLAPSTVAWFWDNDSIRLANYKLTPFATALPVQGKPAWSPDGQSVAYIGTVEWTGRVFVQKLDAPTPLQVAGPPLLGVNSGPPFWSPDSRELYFSRPFGLWRVSVAGGEPVPVQQGGFAGSISPDGRTLVFIRRTESPYPSSYGVYMASPPDAAPRPYEPAPFKAADGVNQPSISFSPDGRKIIVATNPEGQGEKAWLLPWPAGQFRRIFFSNLPVYGGTPQFSWMPDSRHVLFSASTKSSEVVRLFMGDVETARFWPVWAVERGAFSPSVSPDGTKAVYASSLSQFDVVEAPLDGGPIRTVLGSLRTEAMPAFAPVGRTLVYVTNRRGGWEVWMESLAEHRAWPLLAPSDFRLSSGPVSYFMTPVFSPDARRVAVVAMGVAGCRLWVASVAGSAPVRITSEDATEWAPTWSPDGQWIAYLRAAGGKRALAKVKVGASEPPLELSKDANIMVMPEWSPTGEWIACAIPHKAGVTLLSPEGKKPRFLPGRSAPLAWSRDGKIIYQVRGTAISIYQGLGTNKCSLVAIDVATGRDRVIRELGDLRPATPGVPGLRLTVAPDGKSLAWAVSRANSELWMLEGLRTPRPWYQRLPGQR